MRNDIDKAYKKGWISRAELQQLEVYIMSIKKTLLEIHLFRILN